MHGTLQVKEFCPDIHFWIFKEYFLRLYIGIMYVFHAQWTHGDWLQTPTGSRQNFFSLFSSPEPKAQVSYCHSVASGIRRPASVVVVVNFSHFKLLLQNG